MRSLSQVRKQPSMLIKDITKHCQERDEVQNGKAFYADVNCVIKDIIVPDNVDKQMFYFACQTCKKKVV